MFLLLHCVSVLFCASTAHASGLNILFYGGNGFIGSSTVEHILQSFPDASITLVSRLNWVWDSEERIKPRIARAIFCDREDTSDDCTELQEFVAGQERFDFVIDFSAYNAKEMETSIKLLKNKVGVYIFMSTDSVYDACGVPYTGEKHKEEACIVPKHQLEEDAEVDYGEGKIQAEKVLIDQKQQENGFDYIILRCPETFGPRDSTDRFWTLQLWEKIANEMESQILIPPYLHERPLSFVFVKDIAAMVTRILDFTPESLSKTLNQVYNLAFKETPTYDRFLLYIDEVLDVNNEHVIGEDDDEIHLYPSVDCGPINVDKAVELLGWSTTTFEEAVQETVMFNEMAMHDENFSGYRDSVIMDLCENSYEEAEYRCYETIEQMYDLDLGHLYSEHDEL